MKIDWLKAFRAVMQTGTMTDAASIMFRTQPQVSRMIASLESALDIRLFERKGRRLTPTADGVRMFNHIEPLLLAFDGLPDTALDIRKNRSNPIILAVEPFMLHSLLPEAIRRISCEIGVRCSIDICFRGFGLWSTRSNVHLGVVALPFVQTDMTPVSFAEADLVAVLPSGHPLAEREIVEISALKHQPFIALLAGTLLRTQIDVAAAASGVFIEPIIEVGTAVAACDLVARGLGITIVDPIVASSFLPAGVTVRPIPTRLCLTYGFLIKKDHHDTEQLEEVMRMIAQTAVSLGEGRVRIT